MEQWDEKGNNSNQLNLCYYSKALQTFLIIPLYLGECRRVFFSLLQYICPKLHAHVSIVQDNWQYLVVATLWKIEENEAKTEMEL